MPVNICYTNARGEEIVLDNTEWGGQWLWNVWGTDGLEAPSLKYEEVKFANGDSDIVSIEMEPREVTLYFVVRTGAPDLERKLNDLKQKLIQTGAKNQKWGQLMIRRQDHLPLYLNCVYTGGLDEFQRKYRMLNKFSLTFRASDPLFYDGYDTVSKIQIYEEGAWLHFGTRFIFGSETHFRSSDTLHSEAVELQGFRAFPAITITGPARNIMLLNETTGRRIELDDDFQLLNGESFVIETAHEKSAAYWNRADGSVKNGLKYITPESSLDWFLTEGTNELKYRNADTNPESVCELKYRQGWLSTK